MQLGGPIKKDKMFFFVSGQRYQIKTQYSGSKIERQEVSPRLNMKFTFQPTANDNIIASLQYDNYNQKGRTSFLVPAVAATQSQTIDQDSPEYIWNAQYRKVFNSTTFLEVKWTGYWGYYDLNPVDPSPNHYDGKFDTYSGGAGYTAQYDRTRNQVNAAVTKYAELAGSHSFKFGVEIERSSIRDRFGYQGNAYFYDWGGAPSYAYGYSYDLKGKNKRESYYAQDQWKVGNVTLNLGVRLDSIRGDDTTTDKGVYSTFSVGPRLGFAWDLTKKGTTVLKGYYGQLYDSAMFTPYSRAVAGFGPNYTYIPSADWSTLTVDSSTQRLYTMGDNIKHPRVDEVNVSFEQLLGRDFKVTVTGIKRDWKNFINSWNPSATWTTVPYTNPLTGQPMTTYKWTNSSSVANMLITNNDAIQYNLNGSTVKPPEAYRSYRGLMFVFQRALRNRWQGQLSYVYSQTKGTIDNGSYLRDQQQPVREHEQRDHQHGRGSHVWQSARVQVVPGLPNPEAGVVRGRLLPHGTRARSTRRTRGSGRAASAGRSAATCSRTSWRRASTGTTPSARRTCAWRRFSGSGSTGWACTSTCRTSSTRAS